LAKMKAFCAEDLKLSVFMPPFFFLHTGQALRAFEDLVKDGNSIVGKYPNDFRLVEIGEFNDQTGEFVSCTPHVIAVASDFQRQGDLSLAPRSASPRSAPEAVRV